MVSLPQTSDESRTMNNDPRKMFHLECSQPAPMTARSWARVGKVRYSHNCAHSGSQDPRDLRLTIKPGIKSLLS